MIKGKGAPRMGKTSSKKLVKEHQDWELIHYTEAHHFVTMAWKYWQRTKKPHYEQGMDF